MSRLLAYTLKMGHNSHTLMALRNYTKIEEKGRAAENVYYSNRDKEDLQKLKKFLAEKGSLETHKNMVTSPEKVDILKDKQCRQ